MIVLNLFKCFEMCERSRSTQSCVKFNTIHRTGKTTNSLDRLYYMQSFSANKRSIVKIGNKLRLAVHPRLSIGDPYLNIQLALPNPPSLGLSTAITSSIFSVSVSYPPKEGRRKKERETEKERSILREHPKHHDDDGVGCSTPCNFA